MPGCAPLSRTLMPPAERKQAQVIDMFKMTGHIPIMPRTSMHDQILSAGMQTIYAGGYHATSVDRIAAAAGVPKGSFYNHFESKEGLAVAALGEYFRQHKNHLGRLSEDDERTPLERLRSYFEEVARVLEAGNFERGCMIGNLSLEVADRSPALRRRASELLAELTDAVEECLRKAQESGELASGANTRDLAEFAVNSWEGAILRMKADKTKRPLRLFQDFFFDQVLCMSS